MDSTWLADCYPHCGIICSNHPVLQRGYGCERLWGRVFTVPDTPTTGGNSDYGMRSEAKIRGIGCKFVKLR